MEKIKAKCELLNSEKNKSKMYIYGPILSNVSWFLDEDEYTSPQVVKRYLEQLKGEDIEIHINSNGGDVFAGITICNLLKNYDGEITVYVDGIAASAASIICMGADKIIMPDNTTMMIHNAWTVTAGNSLELRKVADDLDKINCSVINSYKDRFVGSDDELISLLDEETYLTSEEAISLGLADSNKNESENLNKTDDEIENASAKETVLSKYRKNFNNKDDETARTQSFIFNKKKERKNA